MIYDWRLSIWTSKIWVKVTHSSGHSADIYYIPSIYRADCKSFKNEVGLLVDAHESSELLTRDIWYPHGKGTPIYRCILGVIYGLKPSPNECFTVIKAHNFLALPQWHCSDLPARTLPCLSSGGSLGASFLLQGWAFDPTCKNVDCTALCILNCVPFRLECTSSGDTATAQGAAHLCSISFSNLSYIASVAM